MSIKILIFSEETDRSSDLVCSWLTQLSKHFLRINREQSYNPQLTISIKSEEVSLEMNVDGISTDFCDYSTVWFRRGCVDVFPIVDSSYLLKGTHNGLYAHMENEGNTLSNYMYSILLSKRHINHPNYYNYNKLNALHEARQVGFRIPKTVISRDSDFIKEFLIRQGNCITKSIQDISVLRVNNTLFSVGKIVQVSVDDITESTYWPSLFQQEIPKRYELRIFYWLGKMYAMAIFSQLDPDSALDFREVDVNGAHPNRMVPYKLPRIVRLKIDKLMKKLNLESGSIDMIVTPDNEYYFLEVNPVGQFNFVSELCNYYIEKNIAISLAQ